MIRTKGPTSPVQRGNQKNRKQLKEEHAIKKLLPLHNSVIWHVTIYDYPADNVTYMVFTEKILHFFNCFFEGQYQPFLIILPDSILIIALKSTHLTCQSVSIGIQTAVVKEWHPCCSCYIHHMNKSNILVIIMSYMDNCFNCRFSNGHNIAS